MKRAGTVLRFVVCSSLISPVSTLAQSPVRMCTETPRAPWCDAVRGDRPVTEGWLAQGRSEVMAQHGIVATVQPIAGQCWRMRSSRLFQACSLTQASTVRSGTPSGSR